jgi:WS/DGAT/MGAT family acyltransferase
MTDVSLLDYAFLAFESEVSPKHVAALQIFDLPEGAPGDFAASLVDKIRDVMPVAPFDRKLERPLMRLPQWTEVPDLDLTEYVFLESVPEPRTLAALLRRIEILHAESLDRSGPLWRMYVFDRLEKRRFAVYVKVHHAYMDGISLSQRAMAALSSDPQVTDIGTFWGVEDPEHHATRKSLIDELLGTAKRAGRAAAVIPALSKLGLKHGLRLLHLGGEDLPVPFTAPRTAFNTPLTPERSIAVVDLPLARVKKIAKHAAVTVNDVLLELCDQAMTRYLEKHGGVPDEPLVAQMPVSLRRPDVEQGNQITIAILELGPKEANPVRRLQDIHAHAADVKHELAVMTPEAAETYTVLMQATAQLGESLGAGGIMPPLGNVVISNIIGPREQLYLCGAALRATYPISTIAPGLALNITVYTCKDTLHVGLVAGKSAILNLKPIATNLRTALADLEKAMGIRPARTKERAKKKPQHR